MLHQQRSHASSAKQCFREQDMSCEASGLPPSLIASRAAAMGLPSHWPNLTVPSRVSPTRPIKLDARRWSRNLFSDSPSWAVVAVAAFWWLLRAPKAPTSCEQHSSIILVSKVRGAYHGDGFCLVELIITRRQKPFLFRSRPDVAWRRGVCDC